MHCPSDQDVNRMSPVQGKSSPVQVKEMYGNLDMVTCITPNTLSLVSFAGMRLDKCNVLRIRTLTGCPLSRESHPLCRLKKRTVI